MTRKSKAAELVKTLDQRINNLVNTDELKDLLKSVALTTHRYKGWRNLSTIWLQRPDSTHLATFNQWIENGYIVKRGSKSIALFRPQNIAPKIDKNTGETVHKGFTIFCTFNVFDETQVRPLTHIEIKNGIKIGHTGHIVKPKVDKPIELSIPKKFDVRTIEGDMGWLPHIMDAMLEDGVQVEIVANLTAFGASYGGLVKLREDETGSMKVSTAIHEWAHEKLHHDKSIKMPKDQQEFEAEAVAWVVCDWLGIPVKSDVYLLGYRKYDLTKSLDRIVKTAIKIFGVICPEDVE